MFYNSVFLGFSEYCGTISASLLEHILSRESSLGQYGTRAVQYSSVELVIMHFECLILILLQVILFALNKFLIMSRVEY